MRVTVPAVLAALMAAGCDGGDIAAEREASAVAEAATLAAAPGRGVAPAGDFRTGEAVLRALYDRTGFPTEATAIRAFFSEDLVAGLTASAGQDYRFGDRGAADGLTLTPISSGPTGSILTARFRQQGRARSVVWTLCRQEDGALRIVDGAFTGSGDEEPVTLRQRLDLPKRPDAC